MSARDSEELPAIIPHPDDRLSELLRASRSIEIEVIPMASVRLSRFTLKQIAKANPIKPGTVRKGLRLRQAKAKAHYQTKRKKKRAYNNTIWQKYSDHKREVDWQISREEWEILWDFIGGVAYRIGRYTKEEPYTMENLWIEGKDGTKLWEGYEDRLRRLGCLL